jgi:hypothetical protein
MPNRFNAKANITQGQQPLPTGYPGSGPVSDFVIPSVGIEDVDVAIFNLFDKELPIQVSGEGHENSKKVPVVFAGGEKWAMLKRNKPLRDKSNTLILPIITIGRTGLSQTASEDLVGRGINQKTGEIIIKRRLDKSDRVYQNLINRTLLKNQSNLAVNPIDAINNQLSTTSAVGDMSEIQTVKSGGYLSGKRDTKNVYETIVVPSPQFITATYEVIVWTQYTHHMNQVLETIMSSFLPQVQGWRIDTASGYWFVAQMEDGSLAPETNFDDMSQGERLIKHKFNIKVPAYILASSAPGVPIAVKKYVSAANVTFDVGTSGNDSSAILNSQSENLVSDPFLGSDDPTLPLGNSPALSRRDDQRSREMRHAFEPGDISRGDKALGSFSRGTNPAKYQKITSVDPSGKESTRYVRVINKNKFTGETTYAPGFDITSLTITSIE